MRMKEDTKDGFKVEKEELEDVVNMFRSIDTKSYDFLVQSGKCYQDVIGLFSVCNEDDRRENISGRVKENNTADAMERKRSIRGPTK